MQFFSKMTYENEVCRSKSGMNLNPFGMLMPGRNFAGSDKYRFGFNGQEKDDEITGQNGSHTTALFWEYDTRIGRRWNMDPVVKSHESPYLTFSGNPIWFSDSKGDNADWFKNDITGNAEYFEDKKRWDSEEMKEKGYSYLGEYKLSKNVYVSLPEVFNYDRDAYLPGMTINGSKYGGNNIGGKAYTYEGKDGLKELGKDAAPVLEVVGVGMQAIGYASLLFGQVELAYPLIEGGNAVSSFADGIEITNAFSDKGIKGGLKEIGKKAVFNGVSRGFKIPIQNSKKLNNIDKLILNTGIDLKTKVVEKTYDNIKNKKK